jgi:hypothetical protein
VLDSARTFGARLSVDRRQSSVARFVAKSPININDPLAPLDQGTASIGQGRASRGGEIG